MIIRGVLLSVYEERLDPLDLDDPTSFYSQNKNIVYTVQVGKVFKMPQQLINQKKIKIRTHYQDSMCGTRFPLDVSYLIYAHLGEGEKFYTGLCHPNELWDDLYQSEIDLVNSLPTLCAD